MTAKVFELIEGSEQHKFVTSHAAISGMTGGFGNGKTAGLAVCTCESRIPLE